MDVRRVTDPSSFLLAASSHLLADEARHNLVLGIAGTLEKHPSVYADFRLWLVEDGGRVVLASLQTPPGNLIVSRPESERAIAALTEAVHEQVGELPGVTAAVPEAEEFAEAWEKRSGCISRSRMRYRIYRLTEVRPVAGVPGRARTATEGDRALLVAWIRAFADEAFPADARPPNPEQAIDTRLRHGAGGFALWEDGEPVSLAGWGGQTTNGVRIGPVYTPPAHRRRGYASALTAAVSAERLAAGRSFCFLSTDLNNPMSNRIYVDVGYEPVCDSVEYAFERRWPGECS